MKKLIFAIFLAIVLAAGTAYADTFYRWYEAGESAEDDAAALCEAHDVCGGTTGLKDSGHDGAGSYWCRCGTPR
jgi:hypothetical protein